MNNNDFQNKSDINFAIVETTRPPIYTCMKYWGKKPHNVWYEYIKNYVPKGGIYLDVFCGSGMSGIEAIRAGKKAICLDLNPLTSFVLDVMSSNYEHDSFVKAANIVIDNVSRNKDYIRFFCYKNLYVLHNAKYKNDKCYECCFVDKSSGARLACSPTDQDLSIISESHGFMFNSTIPNDNFRNTDAFNTSFIKKVGKSYKGLYTNRNLFVLSLIFDEILRVEDKSIKLQLLYAFIQSVHLASRMCVPRGKKTNRDFSTSWGRSGYFVANSEMEMNPLLLFKHNCYGKQSVSSCLDTLKKSVGKIKGKRIINAQMIDLSEDVNLWYGIVDSKQLTSVVPKNSVDFVLTDPPYGGLIQYLDLSNIWLSWLCLYDVDYKPRYEDEIVINKARDVNSFCADMTVVIKEIKNVIKPESKVVLTFNNKKIEVWNSLLKSIQYAGFEIEKVIHQQNKRSGESNVVDKYGTSSSDFYIRCISSNQTPVLLSKEQVSVSIIETAKLIIRNRKEPTPYQILLNGILATISEQHIIFDNIDIQIQSILESRIGIDFVLEDNIDSLAGYYWWIKNEKYNINDKDTLSNRVRYEINKLFSKNVIISEENILTQIYHIFPNGMTPDIVIIKKIIGEICNKKGKQWTKK